MNAFAHIRYAARSDVGRRRPNNEDAFGAFPESGLFCVSDGMGGGDDGEVASVAVVGAVEGFCKAHPQLPGRAYRIDDVASDICARLNETSAWICARSHDKHLKPSGATFVGVCFDASNPSEAMVLHAGDSRLYRMRGRSLKQITKDHSAAELIGARNENEMNPKFRGMILRAVGVQPTVELERTPMEVREGDRILICSDGLSKMVDESAIASLLRDATDLEKGADALIDAANAAGGADNVTAVIVDVGALPCALPAVPLCGRSESETEDDDSGDSPTASDDSSASFDDSSASFCDSSSGSVFAPAQDTADEDSTTRTRDTAIFTSAAIARRRLLKAAAIVAALLAFAAIACALAVFLQRRDAERKSMEARRHDEVARAAEEAGRRAAAVKAEERMRSAEEVRNVSDAKTSGDFASAAISQIGEEPVKAIYASFGALRDDEGGEAARDKLAADVTRDVQEIVRRLCDSVAREMPIIEADLLSPENDAARREGLRERQKRYKEFLAAAAVFSAGNPDDAGTQSRCAEMIRKVPEWFRR